MEQKSFNRREFLKRAGTCAAALTLSGCAWANNQQAKGSCPRGLVNDPWPGQCRSYIDSNGNGICDYSETSTSTSSSTSSQNTAQDTGQNSLASSSTSNSPTATPSAANPTASAPSAANSSPTATPSAVASSGTQPQTAPAFSCNNGCSFPGRCRRFTDTNGNSICDWTENVSSGQNSTSPNGSRNKGGRSF